MKFESVAAEYMVAKARKVRPNTLEGYESALRCHLLPKWEGRDIEDIRHDEIQAWVSGMSYGAAAKAHKTLRQILRWAIRTYRLRIWCETDDIELPKPPLRKTKTLTERQLNQAVHDWRGEAWEPVALVQSACGLRPCEAAALTWGDIDLRSGEVSVTKGRHEVKGEVFTWGTKTDKSTRTVVLPRYAVARLREIRRDVRPKPSALLCDLKPHALYRRMRAWFHRRGIDMCAENLRHTWATLAVKAGVPIETVSMALGHSSLEMAYSRYVARSTDVFRAAQRRFSGLVLGAAPKARLAVA